MRYLLVVLLLISSNTQAQDSTRSVTLKAWQLSRLIGDAHALRLCDTLQRKLSISIDSLQSALNAGDKLIELRTEQRDLKVKECELWEKRFSNSQEIAKEESKIERRRGFRRGICLGSVIGLVLILAL